MIDREEFPDPFTDRPHGAAVPETHPDATPPTRDASIGERLRATREAKGLARTDCARELCLPVKVLERLEGNEFGDSAHFVFLRGALSGYAKLLGLPPGSCDQALRAAAPAEQPALVSVTRTSPARWLLQRYGTAATYIVLTATIAVPLVLLGLRGGLERPSARIVSLDQAPLTATHTAPSTPAASPAGNPAASPDAAPFRASMTPFAAIALGDIAAPGANDAPARPAVAPAPMPAAVGGGQHTLTVAASADCWFEISDADGNKIDSGMLHAGDSRSWHSANALHITLGNAGAVTVTSDDRPVSLDRYQHANVARFDVFAKAAGGGEND